MKLDEKKEWLTELELTGGPVVRFRHVRPEDEPLISKKTGQDSALILVSKRPLEVVQDYLREIAQRGGLTFIGDATQEG